MRRCCFFTVILFALVMTACDTDRVYEKNIDFDNRYWLVNDQPEFEFLIKDTSRSYNVYSDVRNEVSYPKTNLYFTYYLYDSAHRLLQKKLISNLLFDQKTGEPFGSSGLGDIYDHQVPLLRDYTFGHTGKYSVKLEQFMRMDTLPGILAVGIRVEKSAETKK